MKLPRVKTKVEYTRLKGGLDQESPTLSVAPGALLEVLNYLCGDEGGYERMDGYERFDGRTAPSAAVYYYAPCTFAGGGPAVGNTITGAVSGSTGVVITVGSGYINFTKRSAAFNADEEFTVGGVTKGTFTSAQAENGDTTALLHATALSLAADVYRADIAKPSGDLPIRGLALLKGVLYAFVDNALGTAGEIYKQSTGGWVNVPLFHEISFTSGTAEIFEGNTITQLVSGATALVKRVVHESGTWAAGTAAGRLIITTITGTFNATNIFQVASADKATSASLATAIAITPGGRYETIITNFTGSADTKRIYGCDGKNRGFEFDGTVYVPIRTGMVTDTPLHVAEYKNHLFFSFRGSSQNSSIGAPYMWTALTGASEIGIGEDITGYSKEAKTLAIIGRNMSAILSGENIDTFFLDPMEETFGAIPYTIQKVGGKTYCLDDSGVVEMSRAQEFGDFNFASISGKVQTRIDQLRAVATASSTHKAKNQFRLYGSDGYGLCFTIGVGRNGLEYYPSRFYYPNPVACAVSGEDATGKDVVFVGGSNGMVYQVDSGTSFDGTEIEGYAWFPYNNSKTPTILKTYRRAVVEVKANGYTALRMRVEFSYGDPSVQSHIPEDISIPGRGGYWDLANWDEFYYDAKVVSSPSIPIEGDGENLSIFVYSKSKIDLGHKMDGIIIHYTPRRLIR